uniref:Condensin complex subunit 2 n=1 Tax=Attheya septentrionalis TaxID=420275 RepID=A0A6T7G3N6_9STRA|mmetsp:Transcript_16322/g.29699  ORF Transcript_16322/g.29699 Transcript_16322/m.29699 type:complete len:906 (+) Transcript_16322:145-2862(+)
MVVRRLEPSSVLATLDQNRGIDIEQDVDDFGVEKGGMELAYDDDDDDEGEDDEYLAPLTIADESDDDNEDEDETLEEAMGGGVKSEKRGANRRASGAGKQQRRRRRSSARFLRLSGRFDADGEEDSTAKTGEPEQLGEMYRQAIRMNAENRINANNSWGLNLIENIDKFLGDDEDDAPSSMNRSSKQGNGPIVVDKDKRVNFTKASCTLDASVKIYSYRVDDVHLTSYKVLANLNRTDNGNKKGGKNSDDGDEESSNHTASEVGERKQSERRGTTETLESNPSNLNMSKLDSAYDIDPLFHKMSKTFDEGGAKGLLLVNLGVSDHGCGIVFDSKEDSLAESTEINSSTENDDESVEDNNEPQEEMKEGMIDIGCLTCKLESQLGGSNVDSLPLVPQLQALRDMFQQLEEEGFVDNSAPKKRTKSYANSEEEEKEAEASIHREHLERSQASMANNRTAGVSFDDRDEDEFGADDFGGDDDDDDDQGFADFLAMDTNGGRYSSISFTQEAPGEDINPGSAMVHNSTAVLLDALCTGDAFSGGGEYDYFNVAALEKLTTGNIWAGSAHWKKTEKVRHRKEAEAENTKQANKKKTKKERIMVDFTNPPQIDELLKTRKITKSGSDPLQLTKVAKQKHTKSNNVLPPDAGIGIDQLSRLFLRPTAGVRPVDSYKSRKSVAFGDVGAFPHVAFDDGVDESFGDDNDGPGFQFNNDDGNFGEADDFVIENLEGVRKVKKVEVGYATIAKKVDVKRLKHDLWAELELKTSVVPAVNFDTPLADDESTPETVEADDCMEDQKQRIVSFQDTVNELESSQGQNDVTLPFYFICLLHLANEKGLELVPTGTELSDFMITRDDGSAPSFGSLPQETTNGSSTTTIVSQRDKRTNEVASYGDLDEESSSSGEEDEDSD